MGLDIHKYKIVRHENSADSDKPYLFLESDQTNKNILMLFKKFQDYTVDETWEYLNLEKYFDTCGKNINDYTYCGVVSDCIVFKLTDSEAEYTFLNDDYEEQLRSDENVLMFTEEDVVTAGCSYDEPIKKLYYKKQKFYQRDSMSCGYSDEGNIHYILDNKMLDRAKKHAEHNAPILGVSLADDEIMEFDY